MESTSRCVDRRQIRLFLGGQCPDEQAEEIAAHIAKCQACAAATSEASQQSDTIVRLVREADCRFEMEPAFQAARRRLLGIPPPQLTMPSLPLAIGQYTLIEPIGKGGMGRVFKAVHQHLKRTMAVKLLAPERAQDPEAIAGFQREMEAIGRLDSPYIVRATDGGCIDGVYLLVMEFVPGLDLARLLDRIPRLDVADSCEIIRQAALGLQYAHENGLVHCDIKPSNLMLAEHGAIQILDLGLARIRSESVGARFATVAGTVDYMAPEQWSPGGALDIRSDIYGLGCTLFKLLAGHAPFEYSELARHRAHESAPVPSLVELRADLPAPIGSIVNRMLEKRPQDRFAEPSEVAAALAPFCHGNRLTALINRATISTADTVRVRNLQETVASSRIVKGFANRNRLRLLILVLLAFAMAAGIWIVIAPSKADEGWRSVSLGNLHSYSSEDMKASIESRQSPGGTELEVQGLKPINVPLGQSKKLPFKLRASVRSDFDNAAGIYFGFSSGDDQMGRSYQSVTVLRDETNADRAVVRWSAHSDTRNQVTKSEYVIHKWFVDFSAKRPFQMIELTAAENGVSIRWNGVTVVTDVMAEANAPPESRQFQGDYGLLLGSGRAIFRDFQYRMAGSE